MNKDVKTLRSLSSRMNTCQALVNQDCPKRPIRTALGMASALDKLCTSYLKNTDNIQLKQLTIPPQVSQDVTFIATEFGGVKFKIEPKSGKDFLSKLETIGIASFISQFPNASTLVVCEEKYNHTPES